MYTSYEERLALIQALQEGSNSFLAKIPTAVQLNGDGWEFTSIGSQFGMFNGVVIHSSRKGLVDEVIAAIKAENIPADIRLIGPGISQMAALVEHGYKNLGGTPFMVWQADESVDTFQLRSGLSVRRLNQDDLETMCAIYTEIYKMSEAMIIDFKQMLLAGPNDFTYGLFKENEMVSLVTAMVFKDTVGIWNMGTPTTHQKNGYGQELLQYVMHTHKNMGGKTFMLYATVAGKFLYDKCGWITLDYLPYLSVVKADS
jgi:hypothetical protein